MSRTRAFHVSTMSFESFSFWAHKSSYWNIFLDIESNQVVGYLTQQQSSVTTVGERRAPTVVGKLAKLDLFFFGIIELLDCVETPIMYSKVLKMEIWDCEWSERNDIHNCWISKWETRWRSLLWCNETFLVSEILCRKSPFTGFLCCCCLGVFELYSSFTFGMGSYKTFL